MNNLTDLVLPLQPKEVKGYVGCDGIHPPESRENWASP